MNEREINPYAAPVGDPVLEAAVIEQTGGIWRDGNRLVMVKTATLPDRCVRCNAPANGRRLKRTLYWHHPLIFVLVLVSLLIYIIVALIVRKKAFVEIGMCDLHYRRRMRSILTWWLITLGCVALMILGITLDLGWAALLVIVIFLGNLLFAVAITRPVAPARIDDNYVWLTKIGPDFLATFPPMA